MKILLNMFFVIEYVVSFKNFASSSLKVDNRKTIDLSYATDHMVMLNSENFDELYDEGSIAVSTENICPAESAKIKLQTGGGKNGAPPLDVKYLPKDPYDQNWGSIGDLYGLKLVEILALKHEVSVNVNSNSNSVYPLAFPASLRQGSSQKLSALVSNNPKLTVVREGIFPFTIGNESLLDEYSFTSKFILWSARLRGCNFKNGLLYGIYNISDARYYSMNIHIPKAYGLMRDRGYLYRSAMKDASDSGLDIKEYLKIVTTNAEQFMWQSKVWGRRELAGKLGEIVRSTGQFVCLLGGKSTGKSLVLGDLAKRNKDKVILVDLRNTANIFTGVIEVLEESRPKAKSFMEQGVRSVINRFQRIVKRRYGLVPDIKATWLGGLKNRSRPLNLLLHELIEERGNVTLIIDDANLFFSTHEKSNEADIRAAKSVLPLLTLLTKQFCKNPRFNFKPDDVTQVIYAGEVPPNEMLALLMGQWGIKANLAAALVSLYGGHVYYTFQAVIRLLALQNEFRVFDPDHSSKVIRCLNVDTADQHRMVEVLAQLAERGFAPLETADKLVAETISLHNVGGVVKKSIATIGLPYELWGDSEWGVVPASQFMRLVISKVLYSRGLIPTFPNVKTKV